MTPLNPQSCQAVQAHLSEYMDGELDAVRHDHVQLHLKQCPPCHEQYLHLRKAQSKAGELLDKKESGLSASESSDLWATLKAQLHEDKKTAVACAPEAPAYDEAFISTYYDGELSRKDSSCEAFEAHLPVCNPCNEQLKSISEISETLHQWGCRLEKACTYEASETILAVLQQAQLNEAMVFENPCVTLSMDELSAYLDQELSDPETLHVTKHLETCDICKSLAGQFHLLSTKIEDITAQLEVHAPDCWPQVQEALMENPGKIIAFPTSALKRNAWWSIPAVAAAVFFLIQLSPQTLLNPGIISEETASIGLEAPMSPSPKKQVALGSASESPFKPVDVRPVKEQGASAENRFVQDLSTQEDRFSDQEKKTWLASGFESEEIPGSFKAKDNALKNERDESTPSAATFSEAFAFAPAAAPQKSLSGGALGARVSERADNKSVTPRSSTKLAYIPSSEEYVMSTYNHRVSADSTAILLENQDFESGH